MPSSLKADLLLLITTLLAASGWVFSKEIVATMAPLLFLSIRFLLASAMLLPFCWRQLRELSRQSLVKIIAFNLLFSVAISTWIIALQLVENISIGAFIINLSLILVPIISLFFGERVSLFVWLSLPIALLGLSLLLLEDEFTFGVGEMMFFVSAVLFAIYFNLNASLAKRVHTTALVTLQMIVTSLITLLISAVTEDWQFQQTSYVWWNLLACIVFATALRFVLMTRAQSIATASHAAVIMTLEPVWVALLAIWLMGESISGLQIGGCALLLFAVLFSRSAPVWKKLNY